MPRLDMASCKDVVQQATLGRAGGACVQAVLIASYLHTRHSPLCQRADAWQLLAIVSSELYGRKKKILCHHASTKPHERTLAYARLRHRQGHLVSIHLSYSVIIRQYLETQYIV